MADGVGVAAAGVDCDGAMFVLLALYLHPLISVDLSHSFLLCDIFKSFCVGV